MKNHFQRILLALLTFFFLSGVCGSLAMAAEVDVNTADVKELTKLPGIGKVTAERMVAERTKNGYFRDMQDLQKRVSGLGKKTASKLEGKVRFSKPTTTGLPEKMTREKENGDWKDGKKEKAGKNSDARPEKKKR